MKRSFLLLFLISHLIYANRSPSVMPITEIELENKDFKVSPEKGFNFKNEIEIQSQNRTPAGVYKKENAESSAINFGLIVFLASLPLAIWLVIMRKSKNSEVKEKAGFYNKTYQFKPYQTTYQKEDDEKDDDSDISKAS